MNKNQRSLPVRIFALLAAIGLGLCLPPQLKADVVILQNGGVITGNVLQQDADGVLIQMNTGTFRYPLSWIREVKKEPATAPHVSNNGRRIPDWAQIVSLLANTGWSQGLKQVPATVINYGNFNSVPYVSFRCAAGGYEINVFGDLNNPAAVQIGAMNYLKQSDEAKSNCVNFICSVLANPDDRKAVRTLNWNQQDSQNNSGMTFQILQPGEMGSYGGWWVSVYNENALASARASEAELASLTQPRAVAPQPMITATNAAAQPAAASSPPAPAAAQPVTTTTDSGVVTTYGAYPAWTAEELAAARAVTPASNPSTAAADTASAADRVYPRSYDRAAGTYGARRR
ncbi:MAG: hypothetical protein ACLQAH_04555 [Limisphaerales bacterium]